ncbi:hypothetical protein KB559_20095 [Paenibacillus sp. Marseille-P2973]|uniref:hypothetical protein n=1 Tax=Paenibacillus sp. Marseille-P2973 TaxID=1871032 RepID=UPI001B374686|nr:hypothetical protein [Paenibacillus sp. Marseille-P2973]MBQ4901148.1 hypothetical protein [Paenibacillus sp. Marseille-P2973]
MGRKKRKLAEFTRFSRQINFTNTSEIIENFNSSIANFERFQELLSGGDEETASRFLRTAGNLMYNACEWSYKNYLDLQYKALFESKVITQRECDGLCAALSGKSCDLKYLISEIGRVASPPPDRVGIDFNVISRNAFLVNNGPKHLAVVPDPQKYLISVAEIRKFIKAYIDPDAELSTSNDSSYGDGNAWYELKLDCDDFDDTNSYCLIVGSLTGAKTEAVRNIFSVKWDLVFDFDPSSDTDGLATMYKEITCVNPLIRDLSRENVRKQLNYSTTPYWVMASGYIDQPESIANQKDWKFKYGRNLSDFLDKFHAEYTKPLKVVIVSFVEERIVEKIIEDFNIAYDNGNDIDFFALSSVGDFGRIEDENFKKSSLTLESLLMHLELTPPTVPNSNVGPIIIHTKDGDKPLDTNFYSRLSDSFELVYKGIETGEMADSLRTNPEFFYRGMVPISWYGLKKHFDIGRNENKTAVKKIVRDLEDKGRVIRSLHYSPGIGGTTAMRRIAWELHDTYPVLILKEHLGDETVSVLEKLYNLCKLPILVLADSNNISAVDARKLHSEIKAINFPFYIYYIERVGRFSKPSSIHSNEVLKLLDDTEAKEMKLNLVPFVGDPSNMIQLERICDVESEERSPFIMSMYAFEKEFKGVKHYVANFFKDLIPESKKILCYIALADYANKDIDVQFFAELFENSEIENFLFEQDSAFNSLVALQEKHPSKKSFRIKYPMFATEILIQLSNGRNGEQISFINLLDYLLSFIEDSRKNKYFYNRDTVELLRSLFITRVEDADSTRPTFSPLIEQLREESEVYSYTSNLSDDIIGRIFKKLVVIYPDEPHFIAHLARFYFYIEKDYEKGFQAIEEAIDASQSIGKVDPMLYHMKAMGHSSRITNKYIPAIRKHYRENELDEMNALIEHLKTDAEQAMNIFEDVRSMDSGIAGYLSDINLCIRIVDMAKYTTGYYDSAEFLANNSDSWYMYFVDRACTLAKACESKVTDRDATLVSEMDAELKTMLGDLESTISIWEKYLENTINKRKPQARRMLARAYHNKNERITPDKRNQLEIKRIVELMQENLYEEKSEPENIRIWFNAIRWLKSDNPDEVIDDAIIKLNTWAHSTGSVEAYYYRFILKFLKALDGSTAAEQELPRLLRELKSKTERMHNSTIIHEWLGGNGEGLGKLINARDYRVTKKDEDLKNDLHLLTGRITEKHYVNDNHAYISLFGIEIFFNPNATGGEIDHSQTNQKVKFGMGFSYEGPRAFNQSIEITTGGSESIPEVLGSLGYGRIVKCEVLKNIEHYVKVRIIGFEVTGSIHVNNLKTYSREMRPPIGKVFDAMILNRGYDTKTNSEIWNMTMKFDKGEDTDDSDNPFRAKLRQFKKD